MKDFGPIVYLDLHKTGSSYTMQFLRKTSRLKLIYKDVHGTVGARHDPAKFYFITIRHPVSQYVSLFRFGLDGKGMLYNRLRRRGLAADLYKEGNDHFNKWLAFVLDEDNADIVDRLYPPAARLGIGFQTFRFLSFAFKHPKETFAEATGYDDLIARYRDQSILNQIIPNEKLSEGLKELATRTFPQHFRPRMVREYFEADTKVNAAKSSSASLYAPEGAVRDLLEDREKFLLSEFYS